MNTPVTFDVDAFSQLPAIYPADDHVRPGVKSLYFENEPYFGKETRVFAWLGMPYLKTGNSCPAMVLVHGGGGTALDEWVRLWNGRGYAAIAIDLGGCKPETPIPLDGVIHERHEYAGPAGCHASFAQMNDAVEHHWQYHAITALLRAHTILANTDGVDASRIGITGVSWGGIITCLMMGIDPRYAAAISVYGCGFLADIPFGQGYEEYNNAKPEELDKWHEYWDPRHYLPNATMPTLWMTGANDGFALDVLKQSYSSTPDPTLCIAIDMPHGHSCAWTPRETHHFTDAIFRGGAPLPEHVSTHIDNGQLVCTFKSARPLMKAEFYYTRALGLWSDRKWRATPVSTDEMDSPYTVTAQLPARTTAAFVNVWDDRDLLVSSPHIDMTTG